MDDCFLHNTHPFHENIDYMSKCPILDYHLYLCWKLNNSIAIKLAQGDICTTIPSTISRRLENVTWRRWYKNLLQLDESLPAQINWNKAHDITWLYGPKYVGEDQFYEMARPLKPSVSQKNIHQIAYPEEVESDASSVGSGASSLRLDESLDDESESDDENDCNTYGLKPTLKRHGARQLVLCRWAGPTKKKCVKFNYIVNFREFVNGMLFDYDYLDPLCL